MPSASDFLLVDALDWLRLHRVEVAIDHVNGSWRYVMDGVATTEGEIVARAIALGLLKTGLMQ